MTPELRAAIFDAAATNLTYNAPLGAERAARLQHWLAVQARSFAGGPSQPTGSPGSRPAGEAIGIVDLGCGTGSFLVGATKALAGTSASNRSFSVGVDTNRGALVEARRRVDADPVDALDLVESDLAEWWPPTTGPTAVIVIGAEHAFGGLDATLVELRRDDLAIAALLGVGFWAAEPTPWCREAFGELPSSAGELRRRAERAGWRVDLSERSDSTEWAEFERAWCDGAERAAEGRDAAQQAQVAAFVASRRADLTEYEGILGFAWLGLVPRVDEG